MVGGVSAALSPDPPPQMEQCSIFSYAMKMDQLHWMFPD
jgi:hypothetical protein